MAPHPPSHVLDSAGLTSPGRKRDHNEDALLCCPALGLWAVADGMGGHQLGEVASAVALAALQQAVAAGHDLRSAVQAANHAVRTAAALPGMGTTIVTVLFDGAEFELAWVGDSRAYRVNSAGILPLSRDHSWVQAMIDAGEMRPDEATRHGWRNVILQCLGRDEAPEIGLLTGTLQPGELLLLCSDGLNGELTDDEIHRLCVEADTLEQLVERLVAEANTRGGRDNITCIVLGRSLTDQVTPSLGQRVLHMLSKPLKSLVGRAS
ncbi:PP2C family protein-serine/threonine phosphatase [Stutzerimonas marianensis]|uniref:PP2C family protein-serine/threonine phosphatase n=1 Tax=Stutzerimonas marianensis TaxID=2929513 RepID=UPI003C2DD94D